MQKNKKFIFIKTIALMQFTLLYTGALIFFPHQGWTNDKSEAKNAISVAQKAIEFLDKNTYLKKHIPYKEYYNARVYFDTAQYQFSEERDYSNASYFAEMALFEAETAIAIARTRYAHYQKLKIENEYYLEILQSAGRTSSIKFALTKAGFFRENNQHKRIFVDSQLFKKDFSDISKNGKKCLNKIIAVLKFLRKGTLELIAFFPESSSQKDLTEKKLKLIENYFQTQKGISAIKLSTKIVTKTDGIVIGDELFHFHGIEVLLSGIQ
ncbi:MAG: hypothetical protein N2316_04070 [Spirochaetes bacterium]|nr:hypothetical protein [Spirochaetota bacterium]